MNVDDVKKVAVIGAGLIGQAAALEFSLGGYQVNLNSRSQESLQRGMAGVQGMFRRVIGFGMATQEQADAAMSRISTSVDLKTCVQDVQVVYEAVYEDLKLKQRLFRDMDAFCAESTIFVSGTSTLSLKDLASATNRPHKMLLANYSNPPYLVPLAEVMRNEDTSDETVQVFCDLLIRAGKKPVVIQKEVPGFVGNRLQVSLLREALHLIEEGVVTAQDVDMIIKSSIGRRWAVAGIFEVFELAGVDLILSVSGYLIPYLSTTTEPSPVLRQKVERGELGVKTGKGFYDWTLESAEALRQRIAHALVEIEKWSQTG
jgi:3-hydroxybutyryl-CoA dehydrogenase